MKKNTLLSRIRNSKTVKGILFTVMLSMLFEIISPTAALALTSGPSSPEFASFEPVASTDMVNDLTGDFTYNLPVVSIPGPDGGGYSMSLSYHSGGSSEEEASWVGFGWTLNPGAINRGKRGFADDFNDVNIEKYNKIRPNWTQVSAFDANMEFNSTDQAKDEGGIDDLKSNGKAKKSANKSNSKFEFGGVNGFGGGAGNGDDNPWGFTITPSFTNSIRYNNYSGFSSTKSFGVSAMGLANLNMNLSGGEATFGFSVNPLKILANYASKLVATRKNEMKSAGVDPEKPIDKCEKSLVNNYRKADRINKALNNLTDFYSVHSYNAPAVPFSVAYASGKAFNFSLSLQINPYGPVGFQFGLKGHLNGQANVPYSNEHSAMGYLYSSEMANNIFDDNDYKNDQIKVGDYQIEKETTFNKHDKNLGIPFNNADIFTVSGAGSMGGFSIHHSTIGHFQSNYLKQKDEIRQLGFEVGVGGTIQIGFDIGIGKTVTEIGDWNKFVGGNEGATFSNYNEAFMQFNSDPGTSLAYTGTEENKFATIGGSLFGRKLDVADLNSVIKPESLKNASSKIRYSIFDAAGDLPQSGNFSVIDKASFDKYLAGLNDSYASLIGQIEVTNKDGNVSVYGLPVFTKNEYDLSFGIAETEEHINDISYLKSQTAYLGESVDVMKNNTVSGQKIAKPWASTYLLTQNTTFDYIDADDIAGPSDGDFGGWTRFDYRKAFGDGSNWYQYRSPYNGLYYNRGRLLDKKDQTGSMSRGEKEVYYLKAIETKTHIAFFVTNKSSQDNFSSYLGENGTDLSAYLDGSAINRKDGNGARLLSGGIDPNADDLNAAIPVNNSQSVEKLEKIVLFAKDDFSKPISVTNFEYSYELCQGLPNSEQGAGKLTLKKVWTEGGGTHKSRISPYQFEYNYFRNYSNRILTKYPNLNDVYQSLPVSSENPNYVAGQLDAWGNYQLNGIDRFIRMQPWVNQSNDPNLDPAAWQLKRIILPSGGEIHVQYEQKDYSYVMNKKAMVMTPLTDDTHMNNDHKDFGYFSDDNGYKINPSGLSNSEKDLYADMLKSYFVGQQNKIYFKFLYSMNGDNEPSLTNYDRKTSYVDGYTTVRDVYTDGGNIIIKLGEDKDNGQSHYKDRTLPRWVGYQMACSNGGVSLARQVSFGEDVLDDDDDILAAAYNSGSEDVDEDEFKKKLRKLSKANCFDFFGEWVAGLDSDQGFKPSKREHYCRKQNFQDSYFKLPVFKSKKGGGCRVKRILTYDKGFASESGGEMVYGTEYIYQLEGSGLSSGVATNEPMGMREENALVGFLERKPQKKIDKLLNGRDTKQYEGPLGEHLLPSASIAYSRVVIKNIHSGKTTTGYAVNEYYTCKDFPMRVDFSKLSKDENTYRKLNLDLPLGLINIGLHKAWVTQGYLFKLNDMHGKPKTQMTFSGNYDTENPTANLYKFPTSKTVYNYSKPGENVDVLFLEGNSFKHLKQNLGFEEDITMYRTRVKEATTNFALEIDLNINLPIYVTLGFDFSFDYTLNDFSQHVTSKVINQKSFLLSTTSTVDGVTQTTENIAFDRNTGDPVFTRTYDGFTSKDEQIYTKNDNADKHSGYVYALNIPASWVYAGMGKGSYNDAYSNQLSASVGSIVSYGISELYDGIKADQSNIATNFSNVVNANAVVLRNGYWFTTDNPLFSSLSQEYSIPTSGTINDKLNSHYYPYRSYVYRSNVKDGLQNQIYGGGYIESGFSFFNWDDSPENYSSNYGTNWFSVSEVLAYTPHGSPIAEKDILNIYSVAKYGVDKTKTLPYLLAQNASYKQVEFKDYELISSMFSNQAHSGAKSLDLVGAISQPIFTDYDFSDLQARGISLKLWLRSSLSDNPSNPNYLKKNPNPQLKALIAGNAYSMKRIAQTGEWSLYSVDINTSGINGLQDIRLSYHFMSNESVFIDDVRIQPKDALMNCTVYSKDKKVLAQFSDQHFGVFYEYNQEGVLMRQLIETEKGKKTIKEQHQNAPKINR